MRLVFLSNTINEMKIMKTKPFNLEEALRTNRAVTRHGMLVIIAGHQKNTVNYSEIVGWIDIGKGKPFLCYNSWDEEGKNEYEEAYDLFLPADEPKLRPWKMEEVPLNAWVRLERENEIHKIVQIEKGGVFFMKNGQMVDYHFEDLKDFFVYTLDGKTFHPCGVLE